MSSDEERECVIKMSASKLLKHNKLLLEAMDQQVLQAAKLGMRGTMLMHKSLAISVNEGIPPPENFCEEPFIRRAFKWSNQNNPSECGFDLLSRTIATTPFKSETNVIGQFQLVSYLTKELVTNIKASVKPKAESSVRSSIKMFALLNHAMDSRSRQNKIKKEIFRQIFHPNTNPPRTPVPLSEDAQDLIKFHRKGLCMTEADDPRPWHFQNRHILHMVVYHLGIVLNDIEVFERENPDVPIKKVSPLPMFNMSRRHVSYDLKNVRCLLSIYKELGGKFPSDVTQPLPAERKWTTEHVKEYLLSMFDISAVKGVGKQRKFHGVVFTSDGVTACVHYLKNDQAVILSAEAACLNSIEALDLNSFLNMDEDDVESVNLPEDIDLAELSHQLKTQVVVREEEEVEEEVNGEEKPKKVEIAFDPGRVNILKGGVYANGELVAVVKLTQNQYYEISHINVCHKINLKWNFTLRALNEGLLVFNLKTMNLEDIDDAINFYNDDDIYYFGWRKKGASKKWRRQSFYLERMKTKCLDQFLNSLRKYGDTDPIIYYGSGDFPSGQKGEQYVPCKWIKRRCWVYFHCIEVNKFRTSSVCPDCFSCLWNVVKSKKEIRGLKWCPSEQCKSCPLKDRDYVGFSCIYIKRSPGYPEILDRPSAERGEYWHTNAKIHQFKPPH